MNKLPLVYEEPKKWKNKVKKEAIFLDSKDRGEIQKLIEAIPKGSEAKIVVQRKGKKKKERPYPYKKPFPYMGNIEYDVFKAAIDEIPDGAEVDITIFWNEKEDLLKKMEKEMNIKRGV